MNEKGYTYRCNRTCPIRKKCFIIKATDKIREPITVLYKCLAQKRDIEISIGGDRSP